MEEPETYEEWVDFFEWVREPAASTRRYRKARRVQVTRRV